MSSRLRIIVGGFLGLLPAGGVTWDYIQYPLGFAALGLDVFYIEDTRLWSVYQSGSADGTDCSANVSYLAAAMNAFGLSERWAYRDEASGRWFGLSEKQVTEICRTADVFVNISCSTYMRDQYRSIPVRALIDSDPMFTQIQYVADAGSTNGTAGMRDMVEAHTHHFTFGQNYGSSDCRMPHCGVNWQTTRQPICLAYWPATAVPQSRGTAYTTVMNWSAAPPLEYKGESWGQKNVEFTRLMSLPERLSGIPLAVAVGQTTGAPFPTDVACKHGWRVLSAECVPDWNSYRAFIQGSRGEFSVAKEAYIKGLTGWFSCRSACYLAAGRPVITQDTGWSRYLPSEAGLLAFSNEEQAATALARIDADLPAHGRAARRIAEEFFDSDRVLGDLLRQLGA